MNEDTRQEDRPRGAERPARRRRRRLLTALLALGLGLALLVLTLPRAVAAFWESFRDKTVTRLHGQEMPSAVGLRAVVASRELAIAWAPSGRSYAELTAALLALAETAAEDEAAQHALLDGAALAAQHSLARAPADARGWLQHARLTLQRGGAPPEAAAALGRSLRTGPYDGPGVVLMRLQLCLTVWPELAPVDRALVADQIRLAWRSAPGGVLELALEPDHWPVIADALGDQPEALVLLRAVGAGAPAPGG